MIEPEPLQQVRRTYVSVRSRTLSYFGGCDYLRLASHPAVLRGLRFGTAKFGLNVAASRTTTGNHQLYLDLEHALADFFKADSALVVPSGYMTNLIVAQALAGHFSHALLDERSHSSLQDAATFLDCPILRFKHRDVEDLARAVQRCGAEARPILLTDGMFSHDGSVAPLREYLRILPRDGLALVDDAHGAGVLGRHGRGTLEECGVGRRRVIQTITLSKALGVYGGAILGPTGTRKHVVERSRIFAGATPLPLPLVSAALQALQIVTKGKGALQQRLSRKAGFVKNGLRTVGFPVADHPGPIIPVKPQNRRAGAALQRVLLNFGIHPPLIKYHGGPKEGYFRFAISSEHTLAQLRALVAAIGAWAKLA